MSSHFASRPGARRAALLLAALLPILATAWSGVASCCVMREACCPSGPARQEHDRPGMKGPLPPCCQQLAPAGIAPWNGKATQAPGASLVAVLTDPPAVSFVPRVASLVAAAPAEAPIGAPPRSGTARAPPQA